MLTRKFQVMESEGGSTQTRMMDASELRSMIDDHTHVDAVIDMKGGNSFPVCTIPEGSKLKKVAVQIVESIIQDGNTTAIGLGAKDSPISVGRTKDLVKNQQFNLAKVFDFHKETVLSVNGVTASGALGDKPITSGKVRVVICYEPPYALPDV